ncbi:hypothetical protein [Aneurinibacillus uraniidurans]|nr:hypothetical protein [Aneurinibacillus sp. B1]WCN39631.1 hypothetical protein PO771_09600 [Aneurinibacillus sp. B1]
MKKYILLLSLTFIVIFTGYNQKEKEVAHTQEPDKPVAVSEAKLH